MRLKTRFLLIFLVISLITMLTITIFTYDRYTRLINAQTTQIYSNELDRAQSVLAGTIANINHIADIFLFYSENTDSIVSDLQHYADPAQTPPEYETYLTNLNIKFICQNLIYSSDYINGIFVMTPCGVNLGYGYGGDTDIVYGYKPFGETWYKAVLAAQGKMLVSPLSSKDYLIQRQPSISFAKALYDVYTHEFLGVLLIDCNPTVFDLSSVNTLPDSITLSIKKSSGDILASSGAGGGSNKSDSTVISVPLDIDDLTLTAAVNKDRLYREFGVTRMIIVVIAGVCAFIFLIISVILSNFLTAPIAKLSGLMASHTMQPAASDDRSLRREDEIGVLYKEYNDMLDELKEHIKNEYQNKLITLDSQMKALEAQINSHFLYNTLESINSIAELEGVENISVMSLALGSMFRYSIKTQSELVTIDDELKHVKDYIAIQRIRFDNRFSATYNVAEPLLKYKMLKLILQPIVENAFYHGLQYCSAGNAISVACHDEGQNLVFVISDNGAGMSAEQLRELRLKLTEEASFTELGHRESQSIGLKNINSRIKLYYGSAYGLSVESGLGRGTAVKIVVPVISYEV